jgi:O-acetyl-ADP-ribose deacetylase (regulator of RNase III)
MSAKDDVVVRLLRHFSGELHRDLACIPTPEARRAALHAIFVQRPPSPIPEEVLQLQDALLALELAERGVVRAADLPALPHFPRLALWQGDITRLDADAIVNAANGGLLGCFQPSHRCIDNVIHSNAGFRLRLACNALMLAEFPGGAWDEPPGRARITPAFALPARFVVHTVGPIVSGRLNDRHRGLLRQCYRSCLSVAAESGCRSIAFCCISTGLFCFPKRDAAEIAIATAREFLDEGERRLEKVIFNVFTDEDRGIYKERLDLLEQAAAQADGASG